MLSLLKPPFRGGGSIASYDENNAINKTNISAFEAGSPNVAGILGMAAGIKYMNDYDDFEARKDLCEFAYNELSKLDNIEFFSKPRDGNVIFRLKGFASQDVVSYLGHKNVILRSGKHCAHYLFNSMNIQDTIRMSFGIYNNKEDVLKAVDLIKNGGDFIDGL